jgi:hypothetical protein
MARAICGFLLILLWGSLGFSQVLSPLYRFKEASTSLSPYEIQSIEGYFIEAESRLPLKVRTAFPEGIPVKFDKLREHVQGRAKHQVGITLNVSLIPLLIQGPRADLLPQGPSQYNNLWTEALGTLLHETAHLYDFLNLHSESVKSFVQDCRRADLHNESGISSHCEILKTLKTTISTDPRYLEAAGWPLASQGNNYRKKENVLSFRSVDAIELKNPYEHFASNFEHYLLEPEYSCRKPTLADFFDRHFQIKSQNNCEDLLYVNPSSTRADLTVQKLPLDRVYQVQLLHAGPGSQFMSNWGHSMFRVVICSPERLSVGPECLKDENHHLVLSFRAFVNTPAINSWKGLTGKYPSRLFFVSFEEVKKTYLDLEGRDLFSFPLKLNSENRNRFLKRALEIHWSYDSQYYFISNNCAVESLNLIRSLNLNFDLLNERIITPNELVRVLERNQLLERPQGTARELLNLGYIHQNRIPFQVHALQLLTGKKESQKSLEEFYKKPFHLRKSIYDLSGANLEQKAARLYLEEIALEKFTTGLSENLLTQAFEMNLKDAQTIIDSYMKSVSYFNSFSAPHEFIKSSRYGIPSQSELSKQIELISSTWNDRKENDNSRRKILDSLIGEDSLTEIKQSETYIQWSRQSLFEE